LVLAGHGRVTSVLNSVLVWAGFGLARLRRCP
jgi:hypothetical protein